MKRNKKKQAVFLAGAEEDLHEIRHYVLNNFGAQAWQDSKTRLKESIEAIKTFPQAGSIPEELAELGLDQHRQVVSGMNRIIYEISDDLIYIHIVCDCRREVRALLTRRLLRALR